MTKVVVENSNNLSINYGFLEKCNFISTNSLALGSAIPLTLTPANCKLTVSNTTFEGVDNLQFIASTNDGTGITDIIASVTKSIFTNVNGATINLLAKATKSNSINNTTFSNIYGVSFSAVYVDALLLEPLYYDSSIFENITSTGAYLPIASPKILSSTIRNYISAGTGGICYRVSLTGCNFDGFIYIADTTVGPNYSFRNILTNFRGAGYYKKTTNASVNTTGYSMDNRVTFGANGIPLDTIAADGSDIDYKVQDGTKVYGIQNVIFAGNIVLTPVNITLV
jgi:hypothetical protein